MFIDLLLSNLFWNFVFKLIINLVIYDILPKKYSNNIADIKYDKLCL